MFMYDLNDQSRGRRAGSYSRLSKEDLEKVQKGLMESISIANQKKIITRYADEHGIEIVEYYSDDGFSGGNFDRPDFKRMINDIECGKIDCVITKDTSRLGREFIETSQYIFKYFPEKNVRYISILDNYDSFNPNGSEEMLPFKNVINDMYLRQASIKSKSTRHDLMKEGYFVGSSVPYGYKRSAEDSRKFVIDKYAANNVKRIFEMKCNGVTDGMIARTLTNEGILPPNVYKNRKMNKVTVTTNLWKNASIKTIICNPVYIGTLIQCKYERVSLKSKKKRLLPKDKWIVKTNVHEPIIDKETFEKANNIKKKEMSVDTRCRKYDYLLKGLVICEECQRPLLVRRCKTKSKNGEEDVYPIYCCRTYATYRNNICSMHYYREDALNELVLNELRQLLLQFSEEKKLDDKYKIVLANSNLIEKYEREYSVNTKKLENIDKAISELYKDKVSNIITMDEFTSIKNNLEKEKINIEKNISDLKIMIENSKPSVMDETKRKKVINNFLQMKNPTKQMMQDLINKITIDKNKNVKIYYNFNIKEGMYE